MRKRFHGLKRLKIRQSWNKYNLYNLSRAEPPKTITRTFFQQKWTAKALTRAYHGETIREKHWQRMFRRSIRSVVPIAPLQLAQTDGSEFALGRGSGLELSPRQVPKPFPKTPYMNMVYAPVERRLDTAIFRALFASSARQARQFVVHGYVKVNGKKMIYPGYQLNPGDMFQVEPDRVLYATGAPKDAKERRTSRKFRLKLKQQAADDSTTNAEDPPSAEESTTPQAEKSSPNPDAKETLTALLAHAKSLLNGPPASITAKRKQDLRAFQSKLRKTLSRPTTLSDSIDAQLLELTAKLQLNAPSLSSLPPSSTSIPPSPRTEDPSPPAPPPFNPRTAAATALLSQEESTLLRAALTMARDNPIDPFKPYATPWRPRDYMAPFVFVPRYLEVHHRICSAVYLRHPVARPGLGEVPTPYPGETNALAFNWYLRRR